jgi:molybdenum cofactor synthesis domain-containing protein
MEAEIITIGDELLIGQVVDTNSAWLAEQLNLLGIKVHQITTISDNREEIIKTLTEVSRHADIILLTGGLGPTKDDVTKLALCEFFDTYLVFNQDAYENVERLFRQRGFLMTEINRQQASIPAACTPIPNPDLWWFDGDWELSAERWEAEKIRQMILTHNPNAIINGRLQGYGDYATPEQNFPVVRPKHNWWELCMTTNNSWGFQFKDQNWKTPYEVITIFADVISNGGNLLLDIGPKEDGTFPPEQINILKELGQWNKKHNEAIFNSLPGLPPGHFYGPTTLSKDSTNIYLFLAGNPQNQIVVRGLFDNIENVSIVGSDISLEWKIVGKISWSLVPGLVYIQVPEKYQDQYMTVIKIKLKDKVHLYRGEGGLDI